MFVPFYILTSSIWEFQFLYICSALEMVSLFHVSCYRSAVVSYCGCTFHLITNDAENNMLLQSAHFFSSYYLLLRALYKFWIQFFCVPYFSQFFFLVSGFLIDFLINIFWKEKCFNILEVQIICILTLCNFCTIFLRYLPNSQSLTSPRSLTALTLTFKSMVHFKS